MEIVNKQFMATKAGIWRPNKQIYWIYELFDNTHISESDVVCSLEYKPYENEWWVFWIQPGWGYRVTMSMVSEGDNKVSYLGVSNGWSTRNQPRWIRLDSLKEEADGV